MSIRATAQVRNDGAVVHETIRGDVEGALSTLTYDDIMKSIESIKAVGLLTAPQYVEKLDWSDIGIFVSSLFSSLANIHVSKYHENRIKII